MVDGDVPSIDLGAIDKFEANSTADLRQQRLALTSAELLEELDGVVVHANSLPEPSSAIVSRFPELVIIRSG